MKVEHQCGTCGKAFMAYACDRRSYCSRECKIVACRRVYRPVTPQLVREQLDYDPATGILRWKIARQRGKPGDVAGSAKSDGYLQTRVEGKLFPCHRLGWCIHYGHWPTSLIDHINGVTSDNRIVNLRLSTNTQNQWNSRRRNNASGYKGVTKSSSGWQARIRANTKLIHLGTYPTAEDAATAYNRAAAVIAGEFAFSQRDAAAAIRARFGLT